MKLAHTIISAAEFIMAALVIAVIFMISCSWKCLFLGIILYCIPKMVSVFHIMWDEALNEEDYQVSYTYKFFLNWGNNKYSLF